jgi:O-antigen ligase
MPPQLALLICLALILWLFLSDQKRLGAVSPGLWLAVAWVALLGSRPVSVWLGVAKPLQTVDDYVEGSPFDRLVLLSLILGGLMVLARRGIRWSEVIAKNKWLFVFYFYLAFSVLWSDYSFVSFKRWIKDFGNIVIVLIILTEQDPVAAIKAVFIRCACVLIPLSVVFIRYFPELGRTYSKTGDQHYTGVTLSKNELGTVLLVCALFLFWDLLQRWHQKPKTAKWTNYIGRFLLLAMIAWLFHMANSATSLACFVLGAGILWAIRKPSFQTKLKQYGVCAAAGLAFVLVLQMFFDVFASLSHLLGRDPTLTGRTEIWRLVLAEKTNPIIGTGFYSFWLGDRVDKFWQMYSFHLNEAHNGYLETYINTGLIGLGLLVAVLISAGKRIIGSFPGTFVLAEMRLALFVVGILYNWSEASFNRLGLVWFALLLILMEAPQSAEYLASARRNVYASMSGDSARFASGLAPSL